MSRMWFAWISLNSNGFAISAGACRVGRLGAADQGDDRVDHVERREQALDDVRAVARLLLEPVLGCAG